ncbi:phage regulatory CII family protein [Mariprofundus ferrooxydans]|uniref:phage regulatory CII family protein n=1 Tax=Mariprofundus ferrooxydans TaxID=314344 RepID=UPI00143060E7|nr:phage regulatory CII family protein [Mariprofundus ferrooxydans]
MCATIEHQRARDRANQALHDAIVRVPGGSRFTRHDEPIRPMGPKLAAEVIHRTPDEIRNMADPNKPDHRFYADDLQQLLLEGMDPIWFEECLRDVGIVCIRVPAVHEHKHLAEEVLSCVKEFGDVGDSINKALDEKSHGGRRITRREFDGITREVDEAVAQLYELLSAVKDEVKS